MSGRCTLPWRQGFAQNHAARYTVITGCVADRIRLPKPRRQRALRGLQPLISCAGHEIAGVRLPDIAVPRATYTGWNVYKAPFPEGELRDRDGSCAPLPKTKAERLADADPRARSRISTAFRRAASKR
jgi:hypothetical protein